MAALKDMLAVVLLGLCVAAGMAHGFLMEQASGADSASQDTVNGNARGGSLVNELKGFQGKRFPTYSAGVAGSEDAANVNHFSDHSVADLPNHFRTGDSSFANQFQKQDDPVATQESSSGSSGDEGYPYNTRFQSEDASLFQINDVNFDNAVPYNYNKFSTLPEGSSSDRLPSTASYMLGDSEEREEARPEHARAGRYGATGASVTNLEVQVASDEKAVPLQEVPAGESPPSWVYDARAGKPGGSADAESFATFASEQHESSAVQAEPAKGHEGPTPYYSPSSDPDGVFYFSNTRSDAQNLSSTVDHDSASAPSIASSATSASTAPLLATQQASRGTHGCPNSYWAEHVGQWPVPLKITTLVAQAFGGVTVKANLEIVYGTTTLFQALLDMRNHPYSKLLRHAVAALLNAHAKPAFPLRPAEVAKLFNAALASKVAATAQAQKFENENHAFGDEECK